jgi:hypothetical protein
MPFTPGPLMQALSKLATAGNNFYEGGWGNGQAMPMPAFGQPQQQQAPTIPFAPMPPVMGTPGQTPPIIGIHEAGNTIPAGKVSAQSSALRRILQAASQRLPQIMSQY